MQNTGVVVRTQLLSYSARAAANPLELICHVVSNKTGPRKTDPKNQHLATALVEAPRRRTNDQKAPPGFILAG